MNKIKWSKPKLRDKGRIVNDPLNKCGVCYSEDLKTFAKLCSLFLSFPHTAKIRKEGDDYFIVF